MEKIETELTKLLDALAPKDRSFVVEFTMKTDNDNVNICVAVGKN